MSLLILLKDELLTTQLMEGRCFHLSAGVRSNCSGQKVGLPYPVLSVFSVSPQIARQQQQLLQQQHKINLLQQQIQVRDQHFSTLPLKESPVISQSDII